MEPYIYTFLAGVATAIAVTLYYCRTIGATLIRLADALDVLRGTRPAGTSKRKVLGASDLNPTQESAVSALKQFGAPIKKARELVLACKEQNDIAAIIRESSALWRQEAA